MMRICPDKLFQYGGVQKTSDGEVNLNEIKNIGPVNFSYRQLVMFKFWYSGLSKAVHNQVKS